MGEIKLKLKLEPTFPLEADSISPDKFSGKSETEIKNLVVYHANEEKTIGNFFDVKTFF